MMKYQITDYVDGDGNVIKSEQISGGKYPVYVWYPVNATDKKVPLLLVTTCPFCKKEYMTPISKTKFKDMKSYGPSYDIVGPDVAEIFMTRMCPTCWDKMDM